MVISAASGPGNVAARPFAADRKDRGRGDEGDGFLAPGICRVPEHARDRRARPVGLRQGDRVERGGAAAQQVLVAADPTGALKWDRAVYEAQAGDVTFVVSNKSSSPHNFAVEGPNMKAQGPNFGANTTTTYTLRGLKPGEYQIICNYPGHRAAGMVTKLIVR